MNEFDFEKNKPRVAGIRLSVLLAHILCMLPLDSTSSKHEIPKKLVVRTISLNESKTFEPISIPEETFIAQAMPLVEESPPEAQEELQITELATEEMEIEEPEDVQVVAVNENIPKPLPEPEKPIQKEEIAKIEEKPKVHSPVKQTATPVKKKDPPKKIPSKPKSKPKPAPKPTQKPAVKKKQVKVVAKKPEAKKPDVKPKKASVSTAQNSKKLAEEKAAKKEQDRQQALISEALSSLEHSETIHTKKSTASKGTETTSKAPSRITSLASDSIVHIEADGVNYSSRERSYYDELVARLKLALKLPEYGEVKVKLTLSRQGKVSKVTVTTAKSRKNKEYIEKILAQTHFPRFGDNFGSAAEHTFLLNLSNELNY